MGCVIRANSLEELLTVLLIILMSEQNLESSQGYQIENLAKIVHRLKLFLKLN